MPNLKPPITSAAQALAYAERIRRAVPVGLDFQPLMTLYLTDRLPVDEIERARDAGVVAVKLYPAGATTNSDAGVTDLRHVRGVLEALQRLGMPLLVHGEVTDSAIDLFDREAVFIDTQLIPLRRDFPELEDRLRAHHHPRRRAVRGRGGAAHRRRRSPPTTCCTTATRCSPAASGRTTTACRCSSARSHRQALVAAATSGSDRYFLGTDSAPHAVHLKEHASGCAGCYTALSALELYAEAFDVAGCARPPRGLCQFSRPGLLRPAAQHRHGDPAARALDAARVHSFRRDLAQAAAWRRNPDLATGRLNLPESPWTQATRIALLVDADNVSIDVLRQVLQRLDEAGARLQHRRAYGSVQKAVEFAEICRDHAIRFLPSTFAGPNATDIAMAIDAVELMLRQPVQEVVIVSSDMDYSPLIVRLRELGCRVVGYGQQGKSGRDIERDYERVYDQFTVVGPTKARPAAKAARRPAVRREAAETVAPQAPVAALPVEPRIAPARQTAPRRRSAAKSAPAAAAMPAPIAPSEAHAHPHRAAAPRWPAAVLAVLDACPDLKKGGLVRLNGVAKALREAGLMKKSGKTTSLFKKLEPHFELVPAEKPESVRFLDA